MDVKAIAVADWARRVGDYGAIATDLDDIDQAMRIVLTTPKGAVPHRPRFGCDAWRYLDYPVSEALAHIVREATDALKEWEPRADVTAITTAVEYSTVTLKIAWTVVLGTAGAVTEVSYAFSKPQ
jgi:phage baseplate assembly protein W